MYQLTFTTASSIIRIRKRLGKGDAMDPSLIDQIYHCEPSLKFCELFDGLSSLWDYSLHRHPYTELIYRKEGFGKTELLDGSQNFTFFDTILYPVNCWHQDRFQASPENVAYCFWVELPQLNLEHPIQVQDHDGKLGSLFSMIHEEYHKSSCCTKQLSLLLRVLLIELIRMSEAAPPTNMERIIQYLNLHMTETISLDTLSSLFFISRSTLTKQFKKETGKTVVEYLNMLRIEKAKLLLITTQKTMEEVAYALGYNSPKYFFRLFKAITGMTPAGFRSSVTEQR